MCFSSHTDPAPPPPPPPAPPPVLQQAAPATSAPRQSDQISMNATGSKQYRTDSLAIGGGDSSGAGNGLAIPS